MDEFPHYWFPAKRYGWGWGLPTAWQGWVIFLVFIALLLGGALWWLPRHGLAAFLIWTAVISAALLAVCWAKGEPPRWRWGDSP